MLGLGKGQESLQEICRSATLPPTANPNRLMRESFGTQSGIKRRQQTLPNPGTLHYLVKIGNHQISCRKAEGDEHMAAVTETGLPDDANYNLLI